MNCTKYFLLFAVAIFISFTSNADEEDCNRLESKFSVEKASEHSAYNMACCAALKGEMDDAFLYLEMAIKKGYRYPQWMEKDSDLASLHRDERWLDIVKRVTAAENLYSSMINIDLYNLYKADQSDRQGENIDWNSVSKRDKARQTKVHKLIASNALLHGDDFFHAAMILQHGGSPENYKLANELSLKAAELNPSNQTAKWLACAAEDRYLQSIGKPQIWGTQYQKQSKDAPWTLEPFDKTAKTDKERIEMGVRTLEQTLAELDKMNEKK